MSPGVRQSEIGAPEVMGVDELLIQAGLQAVIKSITDVLELRRGTEATWSRGRVVDRKSRIVLACAIASAQVQDAIWSAQHERVDIDQRGQSMGKVAYIAHFESGTAGQFVLHAQVVLIRDRSFQVWINEVDASAAVDWQKSGCIEIKIGRWRVRWERIGDIGRNWDRTDRLNRGKDHSLKRGEVQPHTREERRLAVELQIIFAFENVIKHSEPAANAGLGVAARIPRETKARSPVRAIGSSLLRERLDPRGKPFREVRR